jgi:hypothetical protein
VHHGAHAHGGEDDEADAEQQDRTPVGVEVDERRLHRGGVEQRRSRPNSTTSWSRWTSGRREVRRHDPDDD